MAEGEGRARRRPPGPDRADPGRVGRSPSADPRPSGPRLWLRRDRAGGHAPPLRPELARSGRRDDHDPPRPGAPTLGPEPITGRASPRLVRPALFARDAAR